MEYLAPDRIFVSILRQLMISVKVYTTLTMKISVHNTRVFHLLLAFVCFGMKSTTGKKLVTRHFGVCNVKVLVRMDERLRLMSVMIRTSVNTSLQMVKLSVLKLIRVCA